jgi:hypothetical protein
VPDPGGHRVRVLVRYEQARPVREQLHGVRELGGHHRHSGADGLDENAGGDLLGRVVRQHHHVGGSDQPAQRHLVQVDVRPGHRVRDAQLGGQLP